MGNLFAMNKKNLPNIPLYIGDWERDCNVLCLESEAAWLRIVFKMWTKGRQSTIKMTIKALQNLWRCGAEKTQEILAELIDNEIADIAIDNGVVSFTCRRFVNENKLSKIRSKARLSGLELDQNGNKTVTKQKQKSIKIEQNTEDEDEYENEDVIKDEEEIKNGGKRKVEIHPVLERYDHVIKSFSRRGRKLATPDEIEKIISEHGLELVTEKLDAMNNKPKLEYISLSKTLNNWCRDYPNIKLNVNGKAKVEMIGRNRVDEIIEWKERNKHLG